MCFVQTMPYIPKVVVPFTVSLSAMFYSKYVLILSVRITCYRPLGPWLVYGQYIGLRRINLMYLFM